jgi:nitrogenase molybdenum-iron protein alpha/beta subunit
MPECDNPLWPCAMTGAAAALAGFDGVAVVIHGSSGCYYYPTTLLHAPLHGTFILENDVIFGSEDRLLEVIGGIAKTGKRVAVVTTCVPAILGEDIRSMLDGCDVILVDSPGFAGEIEDGYARAIAAMEPRIDPDAAGVNIDGICLFDPFFSGNLQECRRLFAMASVPVGTVFCKDRFGRVSHASPCTIGTNGDFPSGAGDFLGGTLGFDALRSTFAHIGERIEGSDVGPVLAELDSQEERVVRACDKYLHRFDPPSVAIFAGWSYAEFAAGMLEKYLDSDICCIGTRNTPGVSSFPVQKAGGLAQVKALIEAEGPDLLIGSSFERSARPASAFVGIIPPLRGTVRLSPAPLAGINGALAFIEQVLNASMDNKS